MSEINYQIMKDISNANVLAKCSAIGVIFPILGWILGLISYAKVKYLLRLDLKDKDRVYVLKTKKIIIFFLILNTLIFLTTAVLSINYYFNLQKMQTQNVQTAKQLEKENCLIEADKLRKPVRSQYPGESGIDYLNYSAQYNAENVNARELCFDKYGY